MTEKRKVGIIGIGPRGGHALERFIARLVQQNKFSNIQIVLFEATGNFGDGHVYNVNQTESNWINITERILDIQERKPIQTPILEVPGFPSYHDWINKNLSDKVDAFPPRAKIGSYLNQRFSSLIAPLEALGIISTHVERVDEILLLDNSKLQLRTTNGIYDDFDELLLTIGHQPTKMSEQMATWEEYATGKSNISLFKEAYPLSHILSCENLGPQSNIGIRGFGLTMIDVVRRIAEEFGTFSMEDEKTRKCSYQSEKNIKNMFVPFSLDGVPPVPKPLNASIDHWFKPSESQINTFESIIGNPSVQKKAENPNFLINAFVPIAADIYTRLPNIIDSKNLDQCEIENLISNWLKDQSFEDPTIVPMDLSAKEMMNNYVDMATGQRPISLDFCIGQVWRHCQPSIYEKLSFNACSDSVFAEIIQLDESTKRYSYGPPVEAIQQLLALTEADVLNLDVVDDPEIELTEKGWQLGKSGKSIVAEIMIDSVLDPPQVKAVTSSLVKNMLSDNLIQAVHDKLGILTDENGYLIPKENNRVPIALLGRLAKGTVIGVDAILECFGPRVDQWAKQAADNHSTWLNQNTATL